MNDYDRIYSCQGYNYVDYAPDNSVKIGGSCQASSLIMAIKQISGDNSFKITSLKEIFEKYNLFFLNQNYSPKITYPAIPTILADQFRDKMVTLLALKKKKDIIITKDSNFFAKDSIRVYQHKPALENLVFKFSTSIDTQLARIIDTLQQGGLVLPLLYTNNLYMTNTKETAGMMHVALIDKYYLDGKFHIIDPDPGYLYEKENFNNFLEGNLKIKSESRNFSTARRYAKQYHPFKDVSYSISKEHLKKSLVGFTTIIC